MIVLNLLGVIFTIECAEYKADETSESQLWVISFKGKHLYTPTLEQLKPQKFLRKQKRNGQHFFKSGKIVSEEK